jgi:hypothetical protein
MHVRNMHEQVGRDRILGSIPWNWRITEVSFKFGKWVDDGFMIADHQF